MSTQRWKDLAEAARAMADQLRRQWSVEGGKPTPMDLVTLMATLRKVAKLLPPGNRLLGYGTDAECAAIAKLRRAVRWLTENLGVPAGRGARVWREGRDREQVPAWLLADVNEAVAVLDPAGEGKEESTQTHKPTRARGSCDGAMLAVMQRNPDCRGWTLRQWAIAIGYAKSTIQETETWQMLQEIRDKLRAERAQDRRRRRRGD